MTVVQSAQTADVVERVRQILASAGLAATRALIGRLIDEVQTPAPILPARPDSIVTTDLNRPSTSPFLLQTARGRLAPGASEEDKIAVLLSAMGIEGIEGSPLRDALGGANTVQGLAAALYLQGATIPDELAAELGIDLALAAQIAGMVRVLGSGRPRPGTSWGEIGQKLTGRDPDMMRVMPLLNARSLDEAGEMAAGLGFSRDAVEAATPEPLEQPIAGTATLLPGRQVPSAATGEQSGRVWVVGPGGQPMLATLAANYQPPNPKEFLTDEEFQKIIEDRMTNAGESEEQAIAYAENVVNEMTAAAGMSDEDPLIGVNAGYVAYRTLPGYQTQQWLPSGEMIGGGGPSGTQQEVAIEPIYHESDLSAYWLMSPEDLATMQDGMVKAGLLTSGEFTPGNPLDSYDAYRLLLQIANSRGDTSTDALAWLVDLEKEQRPTFTPSAYQAPDYDFLAESMYEIFARDLGRDPEEWEVRQLAGRFGDYYWQQYQAQVELERQQFIAENELPTAAAIQEPGQMATVGGVPVGNMPPAWQQAIDTQRGYSETAAPTAPAQEDPYSSFMQYFRRQYRPEMDMRRQVVNNAYGRDNLFNSIGRMDTLARGGT